MIAFAPAMTRAMTAGTPAGICTAPSPAIALPAAGVLFSAAMAAFIAFSSARTWASDGAPGATIAAADEGAWAAAWWVPFGAGALYFASGSGCSATRA